MRSCASRNARLGNMTCEWRSEYHDVRGHTNERGLDMSKPEEMGDEEQAASKRVKQINIIVTEAEHQAIAFAADLCGVTVSDLVMRIVTGICEPRAMHSRHSRPALIVLDPTLKRLDIANKLNRMDPSRMLGAGEPR